MPLKLLGPLNMLNSAAPAEPLYCPRLLERDSAGAVKVLPTFLIGERQHRLYPLEAQSVDYIASNGNYVTICVGDVGYISRDTLKRLAMVLAEGGFMRITRSLLINVRAIAFAERSGHGSYAFTLSCGICLHSSPAYRGAILGVLPLARTPKRNGQPHGAPVSPPIVSTSSASTSAVS